MPASSPMVSSLGVPLLSPRATVDQRLPLGATWSFADMLARHLDTISGNLITGTISISVMIPTDNVKQANSSSREPLTANTSTLHRGSAGGGDSPASCGSTPPPNPLAATHANTDGNMDATATNVLALTATAKGLSDSQTPIRGDLFNGATVEAVRSSLDCIHKAYEDLSYLSQKLRTAAVTHLEKAQQQPNDTSLSKLAEASTLSSWSAPTRPTSGSIIFEENANTNADWHSLKNFYLEVMAASSTLQSPEATPRGDILTVESKDNSHDGPNPLVTTITPAAGTTDAATCAFGPTAESDSGLSHSHKVAAAGEGRRAISTIAQMHAYIVQYELFKASTHATIVSGNDHNTTALTIASLLDKRSASTLPNKPLTAAPSQNTSSSYNITVTGAEDHFVSIPMLSVEAASTPGAPPLAGPAGANGSKYYSSTNSSTLNTVGGQYGAVGSSFSFGGMGANTLHSVPSNIMSSRLNGTAGSAGMLSQMPSQANLLASSMLAPAASSVWGSSNVPLPHGKKEKIQGIENEVNTSVAEWLNENFTQESDKRRKAKAQVVPSVASASSDGAGANTPAGGESLGMGNESEGSLQNTLRTNGEGGGLLSEITVSSGPSEGNVGPTIAAPADAILGKDGPSIDIASSGEWASDSDEMSDSARRRPNTSGKGGLYSRKMIDDRDGILSEASVRTLLQQFRIPYLDVDNPDFDIFKEIDILEKDLLRKTEKAKSVNSVDGTLKSNLSIPPTSMFDPASDAPSATLSLSAGGGKGGRKRAENTNITSSRLQRKPENIFLFVCMNVMLRYVFVNNFNINIRKLIQYLSVIQSLYRSENPYHNSLHAADVLQTTHIYLTSNGVHHNFSDLEIFCLLFSALVHDVGHLGVNNVFLTKIRHPIAVLYNDKSPLENMHTSIALHIFNMPDYNFLSDGGKWTPDMDSDFRHLVTDIISGTDMKFHASIIANVNDILADGVIEDEEISMLMKAIVHAADLSNPMKPKHLYLNWMRRINEEFWVQGDEERAAGLPISVMCDRRTTKLPESQVGFINFIVKPFVSAFSVLLPNVWVARLEENLAFMADQVAKGKLTVDATPISPFSATATPMQSSDPNEFTAGPDNKSLSPIVDGSESETDHSIGTGTAVGGEDPHNNTSSNNSNNTIHTHAHKDEAPGPLTRKESIHWQSPDGAAIEMDPETGEVLNSRQPPNGRRPSLIAASSTSTGFAAQGSKKNLTGPKRRNVTIAADGEVPTSNSTNTLSTMPMMGTDVTTVDSPPTSPELKSSLRAPHSPMIALPVPEEEDICNGDLLKYTDLIFSNTDRGGGAYSDRFVKFLCLPAPIEAWVDTFRPMAAYTAPRSFSSPPVTPMAAANVSQSSQRLGSGLGGSSTKPAAAGAVTVFLQPSIQTVFAQMTNIKITTVPGLSNILGSDPGAFNPSPASSFMGGDPRDPRFSGSPALSALLTTSAKFERTSLTGFAEAIISPPVTGDYSTEKSSSQQSNTTNTNSRLPSGVFQSPSAVTAIGLPNSAATPPIAAVPSPTAPDPKHLKESPTAVYHIPIDSYENTINISISEAQHSATKGESAHHQQPREDAPIAATLLMPSEGIRGRTRSDASDISMLAHTAAPASYCPLNRRGSMASMLVALPLDSTFILPTASGDGPSPDSVVAWYLEMVLPQLEARAGGEEGPRASTKQALNGSLTDSTYHASATPDGDSGPSSITMDMDTAYAQSVLRFWLPHVSHPILELLPARYLATTEQSGATDISCSGSDAKAIRLIVDAVKVFSEGIKSLAASTATDRGAHPEGEVPSNLAADRITKSSSSGGASKDEIFAQETQRLLDTLGPSAWQLLVSLSEEVGEYTRAKEATVAGQGKQFNSGLLTKAATSAASTSSPPSPALPITPVTAATNTPTGQSVELQATTPFPLIKHLLALSAILWTCTCPPARTGSFNSIGGGGQATSPAAINTLGRRGSRLNQSPGTSYQLPPIAGCTPTLSPMPTSVPNGILRRPLHAGGPHSYTSGQGDNRVAQGISYTHSPSKYIFKGRAALPSATVLRTGASPDQANQTYPNPTDGSQQLLDSHNTTLNGTPARVLRPLRYQHLWMTASPASPTEDIPTHAGDHK